MGRCLWILLPIVIASCKITDPGEPSTKPATLEIQPDTIRTAFLSVTPLAARWSDSANHATKYLWDFGDGSSMPSASLIVTHYYPRVGEYRVTLIAENASDSVIATAHAHVMISAPKFKVELDSDSYTITTESARVFHAKLSPTSSYVTYDWWFDSEAKQRTVSDSTERSFLENGQHMVHVAAVLGGEYVAEDSAVVTVALPTITADELATMETLEVIGANTSTFDQNFSLVNSAGNILTRDASTFTLHHDYVHHTNLGLTAYKDTMDHRTVLWHLRTDRMIDSANVWITDTSVVGSHDSSTTTVIRQFLDASSLKLTSKSDGIATFQGWVLILSKDTAITRLPAPPPHTDCPGAISIGLPVPRFATFIFRRVR